MGLPEQWLADESRFDRVNAEGTRTVARAAREAGARRLVHTSTEDVFHAEPGERFDETKVAGYPKGTAYERSKQRAEQLALAERDGLEVVIVNPAGRLRARAQRDACRSTRASSNRSCGGGCRPSRPAASALVYRRRPRAGTFARRRPRAATASATSCAIRTSPCASSPTRSCAEAGRGWVPPTLPLPLARGMAAGSEALSRVIRRPPLLSRGQLYFFTWNGHPVVDQGRDRAGLAERRRLPRACAAPWTRWACCGSRSSQPRVSPSALPRVGA